MLRRALLAFVAVALVAAAPAPAHRIVSLVPSLTECLYAIGAGPLVAAVSAYTDFPAAARRLPVVASFSSVATERVIALHADAIVGLTSQAGIVADARRAGIRSVLVPDDSLEDIFTDIRVMGEVSGHAADAVRLAAALHARTAAITAAVPKRVHRPRVFVVLGDRPIYTVGDRSYIAELIRLAGGENAASALARPYGEFSAEALLALQPDVLLVGSEVAHAIAYGRAPWNALRAVQRGRVYRVPERVALYRPGPRYNDALAWLAETLAAVPR